MYSAAKRLVREAHIHHGGRMTFGGGQVDEAAIAEKVELAAVFHRRIRRRRGGLPSCRWRAFRAPGMSISTLKWPELLIDGAVFHFLEVIVGDDDLVAGDGDEHVADFGGFAHGHHAEAVHHGFDGLRRIDFGDDDVGAVALGAHGHAAPAPAVARNHNVQAREQQVRGANDAVQRGLAGAVAIVEEVLGERVVDGDDRKLQRAVLGHRAQADHAGGGFFGAADDVLHAGRYAW